MTCADCAQNVHPSAQIGKLGLFISNSVMESRFMFKSQMVYVNINFISNEWLKCEMLLSSVVSLYPKVLTWLVLKSEAKLCPKPGLKSIGHNILVLSKLRRKWLTHIFLWKPKNFKGKTLMTIKTRSEGENWYEPRLIISFSKLILRVVVVVVEEFNVDKWCKFPPSLCKIEATW